MFNHIVVPLDGSQLAECVLPHLIAMARAFGSRVTLLRVLERGDASQGLDLVDWHIRKAEAEAYLNTVAILWRDTGVFMETVALEGDAGVRILEFAQNNGADLILLSSHGRSGLTGWNVSGVVQKIVLRTSTSTMIVRAYQAAPPGTTVLKYRRIMAPLDGSQRAECVLPLVGNLCRQQESVLVLPHVVRKPEMPRRAPPSHVDVELAERLTERNREEGQKYLDQLKGRLPVTSETRLLVSDTLTAPLHELANEEGVDLVVMSAHGYSGETRWPYGTTVISFIAYGTSPLLIVQDVPQNVMEPTLAERAAEEVQNPATTRRLI
jgi:nucleotide-binding universal stress UspA family protein